MSLKDNQKSDWVQKTKHKFKRITGLWRQYKTTKRGERYPVFISGFMNEKAFEILDNIDRSRARFFVIPDLRKRKPERAPEYVLYIAEYNHIE